MSHAPESIQLAIAELEARSRDFETHAGECRETAATLRRLFEVSTLRQTVPDDRAVKHLKSSYTDQPAPVPRRVEATAKPVHAAVPSAAKEGSRRHAQDTERRARVLAFIASRGLVSTKEIAATVGDMSVATVGQFLRQLLDRGEIVRQGDGRASRYRTPTPAPAPEPTLPAAETATAATRKEPDDPGDPDNPDDPEEEAAPRDQETQRAKVAFFILREVLTPAPMHVGDIVMAVHDKFGGGAAFDEISATLQDLVTEGAAARVLKGHEPYFQKTVAPVRPVLESAAVPATSVIGKIKRDLLERVFLRNGSDYTVPQLLEHVRTVPGADLNQLRVALDQLVSKRDIGVRTVGLERRYARRPA